MSSQEKLMTAYEKMISQNVAERHLNITINLKNFKSFIKQIHQKIGRKTFRSSRMKLITSEQK